MIPDPGEKKHLKRSKKRGPRPSKNATLKRKSISGTLWAEVMIQLRREEPRSERRRRRQKSFGGGEELGFSKGKKPASTVSSSPLSSPKHFGLSAPNGKGAKLE